MKLDSKTSFCTSLAMLSTVPGLERPRASLRSENELYASLATAAKELSVRKEKADDKSAIVTDYRVGLSVIVRRGGCGISKPRVVTPSRNAAFAIWWRHKEKKTSETSPEIGACEKRKKSNKSTVTCQLSEDAGLCLGLRWRELR